MEIHLQIPLNARVNCLDGECGHSLELVVDPENHQITHLVVKEKTREQIERLVPIGMISGTSENSISLCCYKEDLATFDIFCEKNVEMVSVDNMVPGERGSYYVFPVTRQILIENKSIPRGQLSFDQETYIEATDGRVGKLVKMFQQLNTVKH